MKPPISWNLYSRQQSQSIEIDGLIIYTPQTKPTLESEYYVIFITNRRTMY